MNIGIAVRIISDGFIFRIILKYLYNYETLFKIYNIIFVHLWEFDKKKHNLLL